jgi:hypothetical protein
MSKRLFLIASFIGFVSCHLDAQTSKDNFSHLQPQHRAVLKKWLANRPWLRPATEDDCEDKANLALMRRDLGRRVHPYYSVADFNGDGRKDFAVLLVVKGKDEVALAVFNAPFTSPRPAYFERRFEKMGNMYIAYNYTISKRWYLGVFEGDHYCNEFDRRPLLMESLERKEQRHVRPSRKSVGSYIWQMAQPDPIRRREIGDLRRPSPRSQNGDRNCARVVARLRSRLSAPESPWVS